MPRKVWSSAWRQVGLLLLLAAIPAVVCGLLQVQADPPLGPGEVRAATALGWGDKALWVDARAQPRFNAAHVPQAVRLTAEEWDTLINGFLDQWDEGKLTVVYCDGGSCDASHAVADRLQSELQIKDVFVLQGGYPAWQRHHR